MKLHLVHRCVFHTAHTEETQNKLILAKLMAILSCMYTYDAEDNSRQRLKILKYSKKR